MAIKIWRKLLILVVLIIFFIPLYGQPCTSFFLDTDEIPVMGTNFDWSIGSGMIVINQRGLMKKGMPVSELDQVLVPSWISKYASLTFNQYGRETPMGGINEAGLVVHQMMLREGIYPKPDSRRPVKNLQWIQYQLDNFSSVEQVIKSDSNIRIQQQEIPGLHYLAADRFGNCASIEWINGKLICHNGDNMPYKILANNTYDDSLRYTKKLQGFGGTMAYEPTSTMSLDRFA
ncbi:MAG: linear amide C-N hydrolase, partial [Desulfobacteraceae bacterium]|nr:linear amide C-N hydrolase [Desulfobacteraceae bacterium]